MIQFCNIEKQQLEKPTSNIDSTLSETTPTILKPANKAYKKNKVILHPNDLCFKNASMETILKQLHQNKGIKVEYSEGIKPSYFTGIIDSSLPIDEIMQQVLISHGYNSTIIGDKFIVHL